MYETSRCPTNPPLFVVGFGLYDAMTPPSNWTWPQPAENHKIYGKIWSENEEFNRSPPFTAIFMTRA